MILCTVRKFKKRRHATYIFLLRDMPVKIPHIVGSILIVGIIGTVLMSKFKTKTPAYWILQLFQIGEI